MKCFFVLIILISFFSCEKFDATNVSCDEKNKCPNDYVCSYGNCEKTKCIDVICENEIKCNTFTGLCDENFECKINGAEEKLNKCGPNENEEATYICTDGHYVEKEGTCKSTLICKNGDEKTTNNVCGINDNKNEYLFCVNNKWETKCDDTDVCINGNKINNVKYCGYNNQGFQKEICINGQWNNENICEITDINCIDGCLNKDECNNNYIQTGLQKCGLNNNGLQKEICVEGEWILYNECEITDFNCINGCIDDDICENCSIENFICTNEINEAFRQVCNNGQWKNIDESINNNLCITEINGLNECGFGNELNGYNNLCIDNTIVCSQWIKRIGSDKNEIAYGLAVDNDENIYVTGFSYGDFDGINNENGNSDGFLVKYNKYGEVVWSKLIGVAGNDNIKKVIFSDNYIYVTGETSGELVSGSFMGISDSFVAKYDTNGNQIWIKQFGTDNVDAVRDIVIMGNDIYLTGLTYGTFSGNTNLGDSDVFIAKYNTNGNFVWIKQIGTNQYDEGVSVKITKISNITHIFISGITLGAFGNNTNSGESDVFLADITEMGNITFIKQFGTIKSDWLSSMAIDKTNNIYLIGINNFPPATPETDTFVYKFTTNGTSQGTTQLWHQIYSSFSTNPDGTTRNRGDFGYSITVDDFDNVYITGDAWGNYENTITSGSTDIFLMKLDNSTGIPIYIKQWGGDLLDTGYNILFKNGYIYLTGETRSNDFFGHLKIDSDDSDTFQGSKGDAFLIKWKE